MRTNQIFSEYLPEIVWIKKQIRQHALTLPLDSDSYVRYYLNDRLNVLSRGPAPLAKAVGFVPYGVFWLSKSFRLEKQSSIRELALSMAYDCLTGTLIDDVYDVKLSERKLLLKLAKNYSDASLRLHQEIFPTASPFWAVLSESRASYARFIRWRTTCQEFDQSLSDAFLEESSRYVVSVLLPSLAGVAILAKREDRIDAISRFLTLFSMSWRLADDLWDWEADLQTRNLNNSTILHWIKSKFDGGRLTKEMVVSTLFDADYVNTIYDRILELSERARRQALELKCPYLNDYFENDWIAYNIAGRDRMLESSELLKSRLESYLGSYSDTLPTRVA